jgi:hypothetical protein
MLMPRCSSSSAGSFLTARCDWSASVLSASICAAILATSARYRPSPISPASRRFSSVCFRFSSSAIRVSTSVIRSLTVFACSSCEVACMRRISNDRCSIPASISDCWTPTTPARRSPGAVSFGTVSFDAACSSDSASPSVAIPTAGTAKSSASPIVTATTSVGRRISVSHIACFFI